MRNPVVFEVLDVLLARRVPLQRIATHADTSQSGWRSSDEQLQLLWLLGWEWAWERKFISISKEQAAGQRLLAAVEALWPRKN
jgi:hypothetical protein